jgi:hypothetical protein
MSIANKTFKNNKTGETIKVLDSFENIAILENKQKIDVRTLMDSNQYTEQIDPNQFFNNQVAYNSLAEKIKTLPTNMMQDDEVSVNPTINNYNEFGPISNESAIVMKSEEDERAELALKYGVSTNTDSLQKQNQAFAQILGDDADELPQVKTYTQPKEEIQRFEVNREDVSKPIRTEIEQKVKVEDPIITMFKRTKRNVDFKINVEITDKIPRLDFIEMMEDSYEISMIDFLADEFTNKILQDPSVIRESIKGKIKQLVYGGEVKSPVNDQITDSVTQVDHSKVIETEPIMVNESGKKTTRKPRAKKETVEK